MTQTNIDVFSTIEVRKQNVLATCDQYEFIGGLKFWALYAVKADDETFDVFDFVGALGYDKRYTNFIMVSPKMAYQVYVPTWATHVVMIANDALVREYEF